MRRRRGFTLIELLVAVAIMGALVLMAQATYVIYMRDSIEATLRQNLWSLRNAIQQFYADHGRYPYDGTDVHGNSVGLLDTASSELSQGVRKGPGNEFPDNRTRYLMEIPIDPTTSQANWRVIPYDNDGDWLPFDDRGDPGVANDFQNGEGNGVWDPTYEALRDDKGEDKTDNTGDFGEGDGRPNRGEDNVDEDDFPGNGTMVPDPPDAQDVTSSNPDWEFL